MEVISKQSSLLNRPQQLIHQLKQLQQLLLQSMFLLPLMQ
jgi:hypothetical protein